MAVKLLMDAGVALSTSRILVLCDNPFAPFVQQGLIRAGAGVEVLASLSAATADRAYDAILVALQPRPELVLSAADVAKIADYWPGSIVAQFWGDIDRSALSAAHIPVWPSQVPASGHMGILPSAVGPEPVIRLQAGGLKVGEVLWRSRLRGISPTLAEQEVEQTGWGQRVRA
jgi:hypothetical protein